MGPLESQLYKRVFAPRVGLPEVSYMELPEAHALQGHWAPGRIVKIAGKPDQAAPRQRIMCWRRKDDQGITKDGTSLLGYKRY